MVGGVGLHQAHAADHLKSPTTLGALVSLVGRLGIHRGTLLRAALLGATARLILWLRRAAGENGGGPGVGEIAFAAVVGAEDAELRRGAGDGIGNGGRRGRDGRGRGGRRDDRGRRDPGGVPRAGQRVADAEVESVSLDRPKEFEWSMRTDADGRFDWDGAPQNPANYVVHKTGFFGKQAVLAANESQQTVALERIDESPGIRVQGRVLNDESGQLVEKFEILVPTLIPIERILNMPND